MFDIGFAELALIGLVVLFVAGPERLPEIARVAGAYLRRIKQLVGDVKADVKKELKEYEDLQAQSLIEEVKSDIGEIIPSEDLQAAKAGLESAKRGAQAAVGGLFEAKKTVSDTVRELKREVSVKEILKSESEPRPEKPHPAPAPQSSPARPAPGPEPASGAQPAPEAAPNPEPGPEPDTGAESNPNIRPEPDKPAPMSASSTEPPA